MSLQNPTHGHHEPGEPEMIAVPMTDLALLLGMVAGFAALMDEHPGIVDPDSLQMVRDTANRLYPRLFPAAEAPK
jgi:hypothetical protein